MAPQEDATRHIEEPKPRTSFSDLPTEIRLAIWKYALISPREILGDVIVLVNFDLENPRAILPSLPICRAVSQHDNLDAPAYVVGGEENSTIEMIKRNRKQIFVLMQTCLEAREVVLSRYILDCASTLTNTIKPWQSDDTLYLTQQGEVSLLKWLGHFEEPLPYFNAVRHLALFLGRSLLFLFPAITVHSDGEGGDIRGLTGSDLTPESVFRHFPNLKTLDLLLDPVNNGEQDSGKLVLYAPIDKPIVRLGHSTPSGVERRVAKYLEAMSKDDWFQDGVPLVECAVLCWKKPKYLRTNPRPSGSMSNALSVFHNMVAATIPPGSSTALSGAALLEAQTALFNQAGATHNSSS